MVHRPGRFLTFAALIALLVAACGGAPASDAPTRSHTQATVPPTTQPVTEEHGDRVEDADSHSEEAHSQDPAHSEEATASSPDEVVVEVVMTEFAFEPSQVSVKAGQTVRFVVANYGLVNHEFRLSNPHRIEEHLASGHDDHGSESNGHHQGDADLFVEVEPGKKGELIVTFPEDSTIFTKMACLIPGHHEAGMEGEITYG